MFGKAFHRVVCKVVAAGVTVTLGERRSATLNALVEFVLARI